MYVDEKCINRDPAVLSQEVIVKYYRVLVLNNYWLLA